MTEPAIVDHYEVLGISPSATESQIRKAWQKRTRATGPGGAELPALNEAAEFLLDPIRRASYDAERSSEPPAVEPEVNPEGEPTVAQPRLDSRWKTAMILGAVAALVVLALALWQGMASTNGDKVKVSAVPAANFSASDADQAAVLDSATTALTSVLSYRYDTMAQSQANAARFLTTKAAAGLAANYTLLINGGKIPGCSIPLAPIAISKTVVSATVVSVGVISVNASEATVGAFVNQVTTRAQGAQVTRQNRITVSMVKQDGKWLVSGLKVPDTDKVLTC